MKIKIAIFFVLILSMLMNIGCYSRNNEDPDIKVKDFLSKNFNVKNISSIKRGAPILGTTENYYCHFLDSNDTNCFGILSLDLNYYIVIYDTIIDDNESELKDAYKSLIDSITTDIESTDDCKINYSVNSILIKKGKSNTKLFNNGKIGIIDLIKTYDYKDKSKENVVGPSKSESIVIFDTENQNRYEFNFDNMK